MMKKLILLLNLIVLIMLCLFTTVPGHTTGLESMVKKLQTDSITDSSEPAYISEDLKTATLPNCTVCTNNGFRTASCRTAPSCSGGGLFGGIFQGIIDFFKNIGSFFKNIFGGLFNGGNNGGGICQPPIDNTYNPPPIDNTPVSPPVDNSDNSTVKPPVDNTDNSDNTNVEPPVEITDKDNNSSTSISELEKKAGVFSYKATKNQSNRSWGSFLTDVENHLPPKYGTQYRDNDKITHAHETTHGINSDIRNYHNKTGKKANGFYLGNNRAVVLVEPDLRKSHAAPFVPASLRTSRYNMYITGMRAWDDTPLYIFDEWVSYTNGSVAGVELAKKGMWRAGWRDGVAGTLEFTVYSFSLAMAIAKHDPNYFKNNPQFKAFMELQAIRAMKAYHEGSKLKEFKWDKQDTFFRNFVSGSDSENLRNFIKKVWGEKFWNSVILGK